MKAFAIVILVGALALAGCEQSKPNRTFANEDECEDAGMSDAFCDRMFPEAEDFFKKKKSKPTATSKPKRSWFKRITRPSRSSRR